MRFDASIRVTKPWLISCDVDVKSGNILTSMECTVDLYTFHYHAGLCTVRVIAIWCSLVLYIQGC